MKKKKQKIKNQYYKKVALEQKPFIRYNAEKKRDSFTCNVNKEERAMLNFYKKKLNQTKDSTCLKQLATIGAKTLQSNLIAPVIDIVIDNKRKNKRLGIYDFEGETFTKESEL